MLIENKDTPVGRFYFVRGKWVPSITTICSAVTPLTPGLRAFLLKNNERDATNIYSSSAERGTRVHLACELLLKGETIQTENFTKDEIKLILGFINWYDTVRDRFELIGQENVTYSTDPSYIAAGRYDILARIDGNITIIDIKTSQSIHPHHKVQCGFYAKCVGADQFMCLQLKTTTKKGFQEHWVEGRAEVHQHYEMFKTFYDTYRFYGFALEPPKEELVPETLTLNKENEDGDELPKSGANDG